MKKINKIMFVQPNTEWFNDKKWHTFPYTIGLFMAILKKEGYITRFLDAEIDNLSVNEVYNNIEDYKPDIVCISCMSMEYAEGFKKVASIVKTISKDIIVIAGGIYPTLLPEITIGDSNIDYVIMGEGEYRLPKLLKALESGNGKVKDINGLAYKKEGKIILQKVTEYIQDLDKLPFPDYGGLDFHAYASKGNKYSYFIYPQHYPYAFTITSRGCPFNCIFCSSKAINGSKIRFRSAENVLKEIEWLLREYHVKEIIFLDDNLYLGKERIKKILNGLIELRKKYFFRWKSPNVALYALDDEILELLKESGCYLIAIAIESGCERVLKLMKKPYTKLDKVREVVKKAKSLGIIVTAMFVIGIPGETWEEIRQTIKFEEELDLVYVTFNIASPLPKTELYEICKKDSLLPKDFEFSDLNFRGYGKANITTNEFTPNELKIVRAFEWDRVNFSDKNKWPIIAEINGITAEELKEWRIKTRRNVLLPANTC